MNVYAYIVYVCIIFNTNARRTHKINTSLRIQCKIFKWYALLLLLFCFAVFVFVVLYCLVAAAASVWPRRPTFCAIELKCDDTRRGVYAGGCVCVCVPARADVVVIVIVVRFLYFSYKIRSCCCYCHGPHEFHLEAQARNTLLQRLCCYATKCNSVTRVSALSLSISVTVFTAVCARACVFAYRLLCFGLVCSFYPHAVVLRFINIVCNNFILL